MNPFILVVVIILGIHVGLNWDNIKNKPSENYIDTTKTKYFENNPFTTLNKQDYSYQDKTKNS